MTRRTPMLTVITAAVLTLVLCGCGAVDRAGGDAAAQARTLRFAIAGIGPGPRRRRTPGPRTWSRARAARSRSSSSTEYAPSIRTRRAGSSRTSARGPSIWVGSGPAHSTSTDTTSSSRCWRRSWWTATNSRPGCSKQGIPAQMASGLDRIGVTAVGRAAWQLLNDHEQGCPLHQPRRPTRAPASRAAESTLTADAFAALGAQVDAAGRWPVRPLRRRCGREYTRLDVGQPVPVDVAAPHRQREPLAQTAGHHGQPRRVQLPGAQPAGCAHRRRRRHSGLRPSR